MNRKTVLAVLVAALFVLAIGAVWVVAQPSTVSACVDVKGKVVALGYTENITCDLEKETIITWSDTGPPGQDGADGVNGTNGIDGVDGKSCSVTQDTGSATINCEDGRSATVYDGADGVNGTNGVDGVDGKSCSVTQGTGSATIDCTDHTSATVYDGADGADGVLNFYQREDTFAPISRKEVLCDTGDVPIGGGFALPEDSGSDQKVLGSRPTDNGWFVVFDTGNAPRGPYVAYVICADMTP